MDVFQLRDDLIDDYSTYVSSFLAIRDTRIASHVETNIAEGHLWPDPRIGLNPAFESGGWIDELAADGRIHPACTSIFRVGKGSTNLFGDPMRLHRHQVEAIEQAKAGNNYVLTTGTGSGKSLAYIVPIVDHVLRNDTGKGIQAIVVYPMNALANSQETELMKFLEFGIEPESKVTFRKYTGQESSVERDEILNNPPDILLTNYVMLELILTRQRDQALIKSAKGLKFLVFDELHTYRGRQGADVAFLARRVRHACEATSTLQCVGTSATLASGGTWLEQRTEIARVASLLFGVEVARDGVIGETLRRATPARDFDDSATVNELRARLADDETPSDYDSHIADPLSSWIEQAFGVEERDGRLVRVVPLAVKGSDGAGSLLAALTGVDRERAEQAIEAQLMAGFNAKHPETHFSAFAFRLHQFISKGDTVYTTLEPEALRYITLQRQTFVPHARNKVLLPLSFCRECGQEYYTVKRTIVKDGPDTFDARDIGDRRATKSEIPGYIYLSTEHAWPDRDSDILERVPDDFLEDKNETLKVKASSRKHLPQEISVGTEATLGGMQQAWFVPSPFRFCLSCGVSYGARQSSDFTKLATLGTEGRSTATSVLSLSAVRALRRDGSIVPKAQKLLSFTDNRQDASLQAGHFNDFVQVGLLRSALLRAVKDSGVEGLDHHQLTAAVFAALALPFGMYAVDPDLKYQARAETERALKDVIGYRIYRDLDRGWRVTAPNLEQSGLLAIDYHSIAELCATDSDWQGTHSALVGASATDRERIVRVLLDHLRRSLAIKVEYLSTDYQDSLKQRSRARLDGLWALDEDEQMTFASLVVPRSRTPKDFRGDTYLGPRSGFGLYLRRPNVFQNVGPLTQLDAADIISDLFKVLSLAGLVERVRGTTHDDPKTGYLLPASAMRWIAGSGKPYHDPVRMPNLPATGRRVNQFFVDFYEHMAAESVGIEAREHTAQVPYAERAEREQAFREGTLPVLYCSPTMELGVDISELNVVNLRNVPPTPANYAQRSGRAGRSGQPALVFTYCAAGSPHDQYFYARPQLMVAGQVTPPRLDLANESLVRAHVHAVWLAASGLSLGSSLRDVLEINDEDNTVEVLQRVADELNDARPRLRAKAIVEEIFTGVEAQLQESVWWSPEWLNATLNAIPQRFEEACERWRGLYRSARNQFDTQTKRIASAATAPKDKDIAKRLRAEAERQMTLLLSDESRQTQSDFYSYRYFASEGFLPGYSFPRLPLSAFIPGGRKIGRDNSEYVARPRFLAISEFGPKTFIYHEGSQYQVTKVILPVSDTIGADGEQALTTAAKRCSYCGYMHKVSSAANPDLCERCGSPLAMALPDMLRMQNVATRRRDRISSDEEERRREGFEIRTGIQFATRHNELSMTRATIEADGDDLGMLIYGDTAKIWRINVGRRRRDVQERLGFILDMERGTWGNEGDDADSDDPITEMSARTKRVIPFVEDDRNCLIFEPSPILQLDNNTMASLAAAIKQAIQVEFQLEDTELAAEPLPDTKDRRTILLYEAAEGGAGVLRRLVEEPHAFAKVAQRALELCHFHPITGAEQQNPNDPNYCEAACYRCLMSYTNQPDHRILDRHTLKGALLMLAEANVSVATLRNVAERVESHLEALWLEWIERNGYRPPSGSQSYIEAANTRPDFLYEAQQAAIYIDGPAHQYPDRVARDLATNAAMSDLGYTVVRFGHEDDWAQIADTYKWIFGEGT